MLAQLVAYFNAKGTDLKNVVQYANGWQLNNISSLHNPESVALTLVVTW